MHQYKSVAYVPPGKSDTVTIQYLDTGEGPAIVMLPSLARSGRDYDDVAQRIIRRGYRVIRPEPRGIRGSTGPMEGLTLHDFGGDVAAVLDQEGTGPVLMVGHAWGSQPARMVAASRPDLVKGLVLAAASAGKMPPGSQEKPYSRLRAEIDGSGDLRLSREERLECLRKAFFAPGHDPSVWLEGWYAHAHDAQSHARIHTPVDDYFSGGSVAPILDLRAEFDAVVIPHIMKAYLGDRVTEGMIRNAGHALAPEQPQAFCDAICDFAQAIMHGTQR